MKFLAGSVLISLMIKTGNSYESQTTVSDYRRGERRGAKKALAKCLGMSKALTLSILHKGRQLEVILDSFISSTPYLSNEMRSVAI